jgi:uncharacterized protein (UPF0332 family)
VLDASKELLAQYRLEKAKECLADAQSEIERGAYGAAANRSYYAIFHTMRAALALSGYDTKKHSGIMSEFRKRYIKTGILPIEFSEVIKAAFDIRGKSDYDDFYIVVKEDIETQVINAEQFINAVNDDILNVVGEKHIEDGFDLAELRDAMANPDAKFTSFEEVKKMLADD